MPTTSPSPTFADQGPLPSLIRDLFSAGDLPAILHQLALLNDDRLRVREENLGLKHEIRRLAQSFAAITEPATGRLITDGVPRRTPPGGPVGRQPSAKAKPPSTEAEADGLSLDDL